MRLLRRSAGEIVFLILAGKSAGAKQVLTFLLRRAGGGGRGGGTVVADKGHEARQSAIACARVREGEREGGARIRRRHGCLGKSKRNAINGH